MPKGVKGVYRRAIPRERCGFIIKCFICSEKFYIKPYKLNIAKYCSNKCRYIALKLKKRVRQGSILQCVICKKEFYVPQYRLKTAKYCSTACYNQKGIPGSTFINNKGYTEIFMPNNKSSYKSGYIREHRFVMEQHIGRLLKKREIVHHVNNIPTDNRIENLKLFKNNAEHIKYHALIRRNHM